MNLYFLSGLGADKRVFQRLALAEDFSVYYIDWIKPLADETISSYAKRISAVIDQTKPFALIGLSFGGMMAVEISKFVHAEKIIIISSAATKFELPWFVKGIRFLPLYRIILTRLLKKANGLVYYLFSIKTTEEKNLMKDMLADADSLILRWSINAVSNWSSKIIPSNLSHIHGNADKLLPIKQTKTQVIIEGGGHFMIYSKAEEISRVLNHLLTQPQL